MSLDRKVTLASRGGPVEVLRLAWPAVVNMLSITLMGITDTYLVGRVGTAEQGAVGFCGTLTWAVLCFFVGTLELVQTFVAQSAGAGNRERATRWGNAGLQLSLLFSLLPLPLVLLGDRPFHWFGVASDMIPFATTYFEIRLIGTVFFLLSRVGDAYYRGLGDTWTPMIITIAVNIVNIVLDLVLIFGWPALGIPAMGVAGAAWATVAATAVHVAIYGILFARSRRQNRPTPRLRAKWCRDDLDRLLRVGAPSGFHWLLDIGAWTVFTLAVARLDAAQTAANMIGITLIRASFMPGHGVSTAAQTLVGQYLGARDIASATRSGWTSMWVGTAYMGLMGIVYLVWGRELVALFTEDPDVIEIGAKLMIWAALFQVGDGVQVILAGALRGAGDTKYVMWTGLLGAWVVFAPLSFYLMNVRGLGVESGWISINAWVIVLSALLVLRFRGSAWTSGSTEEVPPPHPQPEGEVV